jgi:hypothetical protein
MGFSNMISRWYVEWYYTWNHIAEKVDETVLASTTTTLYTTVSIYESNSAAAVASFQSLSATLSLPTPAVRTNSVVSGTPLSVQSSTTNAQVAPTTALATATKASANAIAAGWASSYAIVVFTGLFITPCFLMILL